MSLQRKVQVNDRFQRAIRIDSDIGNEAIVASYICPQSSIEVLLNMALGRKEANESAFIWTGPYGSGKSSLVVAINALLGDSLALRNKATKSIGIKNSEKIQNAFDLKAKKGWTFIPVVGSKSNFTDALARALKDNYDTKKKLTPENLLEQIISISEEEPCGLFIVIDEMGKFLEAAADGISDVYFFQQLAEIAARSEGKIVLLGILHQAFAEYGRKLTREVRDEWSKIQGRFVDLPLNVAGEELIDLIGRAIKSDLKPHKPTKIAKVIASHISNWKPVHEEALAASLTSCWPLHPVTAALLGPISRRRFGQNQRSVFGFLNSAEPFGFQEFLKESSSTDDFYVPARLWDYLKSNLEPSIMSSPDGHKWSIAVDALYRAEAQDSDNRICDLLKTIALMDLFQERSGLVPERDLLLSCVPDIGPDELDKILAKLESQSILRFKKYKRAYSLWEGSDFDIDASIESVDSNGHVLDFDKIRAAARFQPIVAKKHYHDTGALRWFDVDLVPSEQAIKIAQEFVPSDGTMGLMMVVLSEDDVNPEEIEKISKRASEVNPNWPIFVSVANNSWLIRNHAKELQALEWIRSNDPSLGGDTVARREVEARLADSKNRLEEHLASTLSSAKWYIEGNKPIVLSYKELHSLASEKADQLYSESPRINSELLNRIKPSSNTMAALKILLKSMAENSGQERLGIVGYPAEGGLYETLLAGTGLYRPSKGNLSLREPNHANDPNRLLPLWVAADNFFKVNKSRAIPVTELYKIWSSKPFGVKDGLLPFFLMSYILTRSERYAIYREGTYRPGIDDLFIDYLLKSPKDVSLRSMAFTDVGQKILAGVAGTLNALNGDHPELTEISEPLIIARELVSSVLTLAPWVMRTRQLSVNAIRLRELVKNASDPNKVLFDDLPALFKEHSTSLSRGDVQPIIDELESALKELVSAYPALIDNLRSQIFSELEADGVGDEAIKEINRRAKNIMQVTGDFKLDAFASRLSTFSGSLADVEGIVSLASEKPVKEWIDLDVSRAKLRIAELAQQFKHSEAFGRVHNREEYRQAIALMVGIDGKPKTYVHEFTITQNNQAHVKDLEKHILNIISKAPDMNRDLVLAALANVGAAILDKKDRDQVKTPPKKVKQSA